MTTASQIGIDIGSTSIRVVEASRAKGTPVIDNFGQALLPAGAVVGGVVKDDKAVTAALRHLWTTQKIKSKSVTLAVTHQQVVVREVDVANLPAKELHQALPFQVRDVLPLPVDEAVLDFYPLEAAGKKDTVRGLLVAAPKVAVLNTVQAVERAGLRVERVDLACFAMLRSSAHLAHGTEAVVDIGANGTNIVIHAGGVPQIVRTVPRGGAEITELLASRLSMPVAEAEERKCRVGLIRGEGPDVSPVVVEAIRPLVSELRNSLNYHAAAHPERAVARLALVGGSALLPGLTDLLAEQLGVPTILSDPLQRVGDSRRGGRHDNLSRQRSSAAVAIGLTLGAA